MAGSHRKPSTHIPGFDSQQGPLPKIPGITQYRGRSPKAPATVSKTLDEFFKYTDQWLRRYQQSWFRSTDDVPGFDDFKLNFRLQEIPERLDAAIQVLADLAEAAKNGRDILIELKATAEKRLESIKPAKPPKKKVPVVKRKR